jgi:hypothetical protein
MRNRGSERHPWCRQMSFESIPDLDPRYHFGFPKCLFVSALSKTPLIKTIDNTAMQQGVWDTADGDSVVSDVWETADSHQRRSETLRRISGVSEFADSASTVQIPWILNSKLGYLLGCLCEVDSWRDKKPELKISCHCSFKERLIRM